MSAISLAKQAFGREKPHSSITAWVDILTGPSYEEEAYDGVPDLVESINLQAAGPTEASRSIRKKLKHGDSHAQYRALVILKALVENCGHKFQTSFADGHMTDALKHIASGSAGTSPRVQKKLLQVLASWHSQFKNDPSMSTISGLYNPYKPEQRRAPPPAPTVDLEQELRKTEKEEAKRRLKQEKEETKRKEEEDRKRAQQNKNKPRRPPFNFEKEKPQILTSIVTASQASSNLVNAITLVNTEKDSLASNTRVQECLDIAKQVRKPVVRYIQLCEDDELVSVLIETNDRIISAISMYDQLLAAPQEDATQAIQTRLATTHITGSTSEVNKLQEKQRTAVERAISFKGKERSGDPSLHPDLQDLNLLGGGSSSGHLAQPLEPTSEADRHAWTRRGSLSDFSDYESSEEEGPNASGRNYVNVSDDPDDEAFRQEELIDFSDPFADPFADNKVSVKQ